MTKLEPACLAVEVAEIIVDKADQAFLQGWPVSVLTAGGYRAFLEADAVASWLPPFGYTCTVQQLEPEVGGKHRMSFRNFTSGNSHSFGGEYLELVPGERLVYTDRFDDSNLPGEMKVTVTLKAVSVGTEMSVVQEGVPDIIPLEACYLGWQESLRKLTRLVEHEIND